MRVIRRTSQFKKDYKRESKGRHRKTLDGDLAAVLKLLISDTPVPERLRDHPLTGKWNDYRDLHVRPDLVLIYRRPDETFLDLVRLGSHSELGL